MRPQENTVKTERRLCCHKPWNGQGCWKLQEASKVASLVGFWGGMALPTLERQTFNPQNYETLCYSHPGESVATPSYLPSPYPSGFFTGGNGYVGRYVCDLTFARWNSGQRQTEKGRKGKEGKWKDTLLRKQRSLESGLVFHSYAWEQPNSWRNLYK